MSTTDKPNYPVTRPNEDTLASLRISLMSEEDEEDQIELCDLYHEVNSQDLKREIIRKLNPNFDASLDLILEITDDVCLPLSGAAFNQIKKIKDYETLYDAYDRVQVYSPHERLKDEAVARLRYCYNVVSLDSRRR